MTEILFGIRVIKFYAWEPHFSQKVADCRKQELSHLKAIKYLDAMCVYTWAALPVVISILTFVTYVLLGHQLTAPKVGGACCICSPQMVNQLWREPCFPLSSPPPPHAGVHHTGPGGDADHPA